MNQEKITLKCRYCEKDYVRYVALLKPGQRLLPLCSSQCKRRCADYEGGIQKKIPKLMASTDFDRLLLVIDNKKYPAKRVREIVGLSEKVVRHRINNLGWPVLKAYITKLQNK